MSGRNHLKKNQNTPRPSDHPSVIKASTINRMILVHVQKMYNIFRILIGFPDYSSSSFFFFFSKNEEEAIPPGGKKYLGTIKASTRMILVHVQKMYKTSTEDVQYIIEVPDYSSIFFFFQKMKKLSPPEGKNIQGQGKEVLELY